jgi:hypothetical protein
MVATCLYEVNRPKFPFVSNGNLLEKKEHLDGIKSIT